MIETPPQKENFMDENGNQSASWYSFMSSVYIAIFQNSQHGITAKRPTKNLSLWMKFGDDTLGVPIFLKSVKPIVWVKADGTVA